MISVCMACYNGSEYIVEQLHSILNQIEAHDEVIIVNDASQDNSLDIIYSINDDRISIINNEKNVGVARSFEIALNEARGQYIFFSDQDDVWAPNKVKEVVDIFKSQDCNAVITDAIVFNDQRILCSSYFEWRSSGPGLIKNFIKSSFLGCCMAVDAKMIKILLPVPSIDLLHDEWCGLACTVFGKVIFHPVPLVMYRRHATTVTTMRRSPIVWILKNRILRFIAIIIIVTRIAKLKINNIKR